MQQETPKHEEAQAACCTSCDQRRRRKQGLHFLFFFWMSFTEGFLGWEYNQLDWYSKTLSLNDVSRTFHDVFRHVFKMSSDEFTVAGSLLSAVWCALSHNCAVFGLLALEQLSHEDRMIKKSDNDNFCSKLLFFLKIIKIVFIHHQTWDRIYPPTCDRKGIHQPAASSYDTHQFHIVLSKIRNSDVTLSA